jgi:hypothetical protein
MGRPPGHQWLPLGLDADPVPGNTQEISQQAAHLSSVAQTINGQVAALHKIASDNTEIGQHADKIRAAARSLAGSLQTAATRYANVSSALTGWVPDLEQAQSLSIQALNQAEGPYAILNQAFTPPASATLKPLQMQQDIQNHQNAMQRAQGQLDAAQAMLTRATTQRDTQAAYWAAKINQASDDSLTDHESLWGEITSGFDELVGAVAWEIRDVATVLEVLATVAGIAAFIIAQFVPGLDIAVDTLVLGAFLATGIAAGGRAALAASGNGSWRDFAFDAFALASFGAGRGAGLVAKALVPAVETAAKNAYTAELITDIAVDGPRSAMLSKWSAQVGVDTVHMAQRVAHFAPSLANGAELSGFAKVMASLGAYGVEPSNYAKVIWLAGRFTTPISDLSYFGTLAKSSLGVAGISAGAGAATGIAGIVLGGVELDWGKEPIIKLDIPPVYHWYSTNLWAPPAGS